MQHERWDDERWFAVKQVQEIRARHRSDEQVFKARARRAVKERQERAERKALLKRELERASQLAATEDKISTIREIRERSIKEDLDAARRRTLAEKQKKMHAKRKKWLKQGTERCAARLLEGRDAHAAPSTIYASYKKVEKSLKRPTPPEGPWFDDAFLAKLGLQRSDDQKWGRNPLGIFDDT